MKNLNAPHINDVERQAILALVQQLKALLLPKLVQFSADERQQYGAVNEQNKLLINKVAELRQSQPNLSAPQVDWPKFEADYEDRKFLSDLLMLLQSVTYDVQSTKIAHDNDNYNTARIDYAFTEYCAKCDMIGAVQKHGELKQFFKRSSSNKPDEGADEPTEG